MGVRITPRLLVSAAGAALLRRPAPLLVGWSVTHRCNLTCRYCRAYEQEIDELDTAHSLELLEQMAAAGVARVQFTGGEPLLREDLGELLHKARSLGLFATVSTNGILVPASAAELKTAGRLNFSLDGNRENNDAVRGEGCFDAVADAIEAAQRVKIPFKFVTVLNRRNLGDIPFMLDLARRHGTAVLFQPALPEVLRGEVENPEAPPADDYRDAVDRLLAARASGAPVANSWAALRHLRNWPESTRLPCVGGLVFCRIRPDGPMVHCPRGPAPDSPAVNAVSAGFLTAFKTLSRPGCRACWSAPVVEASCLLALKPSSILNVLKGNL